MQNSDLLVLYRIQKKQKILGRAVAQMDGHRSPTVMSRTRSQFTLFEIWLKRMLLDVGFLRVFRVPLPIYTPLNVPRSYIIRNWCCVTTSCRSGRRIEWIESLRSRYDCRSVSQYVLESSPPWDLRPDINSVWISLCCLCWAPSLTRGRVCLLSVAVSNNCPSSSFFFYFFPPFYTSHILCIYNVCKAADPLVSRI
jgi:hypothetical protein